MELDVDVGIFKDLQVNCFLVELPGEVIVEKEKWDLKVRKVAVSDYMLHTSYFGPEDQTVLLIHGGGNSSSSKIHPLRIDLAERGIGTLAVDHLGHGKTAGDIKKSSLMMRVEEVLSAIKEYPIVNILGTVSMSMGGHIAIKLQEILAFNALVLIAPAVYTTSAYPVPFGEGFTNIIRQSGSWNESHIWPILEKFEGKMLVIIGEQDKVIPHGIIDKMQRITKPEVAKIIVLKDVDHFVMTRLREGEKRHLDSLLDLMSSTLITPSVNPR
ncbi:MAG: alpha/beta hydrolase [Pseudomonadales bacterium]|nr:alpha/beta hydrolase [Pseudomonadales bacterium]